MTPLSSSLFFDRTSGTMSALSARAQTLQGQIASGKRLEQPSDDVAAYQQLRGLAVASADDVAVSANVGFAQAKLSTADTTLTAMTAQLQHATELATQARSGTMTDSARQAIAAELGGIAESLTGLANTRDASGQALFGGAGSGAAVVAKADGTHTLATGTTASIPIGEGDRIVPGENATAVLGLPGGRNAIDMLAALSLALKTGGDTSSALGGALDDLAAVSTQVDGVQGSLGARGARLDLVAAQLTTAATARETRRSALEDTDVTQAITDLQKTMTVLQATQASFSKLSSLSLFNYLK